MMNQKKYVTRTMKTGYLYKNLYKRESYVFMEAYKI
jgi:hypothetical protein